ncbi:MAG: hypothetical protein AAFQ10_09365 [Pseudomonadota bacterium]
MSELMMPAPLLAIAESGRITPEDVLLMRRTVFVDHLICQKEAEWLLALDMACSDKCAEWGVFFGDALVTYIVYQADPEGAISEANADWLISCISRDGLVDSPQRFQMLVKVLEKASSAPQRLQIFALQQIAYAVLRNQGPLCSSRAGTQYVICEGDVALMRRVLFAFGGDGGMAITRTEAEFLFYLNDMTRAQENAPVWNTFFVQAVGNHLMATLGNAVPARNIALASDEFMQGEDFFDGLANSLRAVFATARSGSAATEAAMAERNGQLDSALATAGEITQAETNWVYERIGRDGIVHENELALLLFVSQERGGLPQRLQNLLENAA